MFAHTDENQFKVCVGALILVSTPEDRERLNAELRQIAALSAGISGIPVDLSTMPPLENPVGLLRIWQEEKTAV